MGGVSRVQVEEIAMGAGTGGSTPGLTRGTSRQDSHALCWRRVFAGDQAQLSTMRRWLEVLLPPCPARDDVVMVASELAANAILHTASRDTGSFAVEISWSTGSVQVGVADNGAPSGPRIVEDPDGEDGRGLVIVRELSVGHGVSGDERGRLVWARVPWEEGGELGLPHFPDIYESAIRDGLALLAHRFPGTLTWFGPKTRQWWALSAHTGGWDLANAPSAGELAQRLAAKHRSRSSPPGIGQPTSYHRTGATAS
jgi:serine/threonine-protein kinase RsbW